MRTTPLQWAVAGGFAGWAAARLTGADRVRRAEDWAAPLLSLTPQVTVAALATPLLLSHRGPRVTTALAAGALAVAVVPRAVRRRQPPADGQVLRVLTANLFVSRAAARDVVGLVAATGSDVLFLQELTDAGAEQLEDAGLSRLLPFQVAEPVAKGPRGNGLYARYPLRDERDLTLTEHEYWRAPARPVCLMELPSGEEVRLVCVHTHAPTLGRGRHKAARWRADLAVLPAAGAIPAILAGDFNATLDHGHFRALLRRGYVDAAVQAGHGLAMTWGPRAASRAQLALDHVLADSRCAVRATSVHRLAGSDHRAVLAELQLPG